MPERDREDASGPGGNTSASSPGTASPGAKPSPQHVRRAFGRLVGTPTFIASASVVIVATLAYGTTQTHLLYNGTNGSCASANCQYAPPAEAGGAPNAESAERGAVTLPGVTSSARSQAPTPSTSGTSQGGSPVSIPSSPASPTPARGPLAPGPGPSTGTGSAKPKVAVSYQTVKKLTHGYSSAITITNRSKAPIKGWQLWLHYKALWISHVTGVRWFPATAHSRGTGMIVPEPSHQNLAPGASIRFTYQLNGTKLAAPTECVFDGDHCTFTHRG